jgi:ADP-heptose:LPS heptosyltransferase
MQGPIPSDFTYPSPRPPMVGKYLVRKRPVAAGLSAIDAACSIFPSRAPVRSSGGDKEFRSIVFSQCGHLGDLIMTLPALHWVRQFKPEVKIGLIVGSWAKPMMGGIRSLYDASYFADHFMLDRSGRPRKQKLAQHWRSWRSVAAEIRQERYDAAIECYPFLQNSIPLLYSANVPVRAGFTSGGFGPLLTHKACWVHASRPFLDYPRDLLRMLFHDRSLEDQFRPYYPMPSKSSKRPRQPYIVMQTGTGNPLREWAEESWIELAKELTSRGLLVVVAGAGARERERASRIANALPPHAILNVSDLLSWDEFADLVEGAAHVICLESSTSHVAAAFKVPSTVIMPGTNDAKQFGPDNDKADILTFKTPCAPCFRSSGCESMACIRQVSVSDATISVLKSRHLAELQSTGNACS